MFKSKKLKLKGHTKKVGKIYDYIVDHTNEREMFWEKIGWNKVNYGLVALSESDFNNLILNVSNWTEIQQRILTDTIAQSIDGRLYKSLSTEQKKIAKKIHFKIPNYTQLRHKKLKEDLRAKSPSKSTNKWVLEIYDIILENEQVDTEFWWLVGKDYFYPYYDKFKTEDWNDLIEDIFNWTSDQQEIFLITLTQDSPENIDK
ncbi:MAG: hypothetical protein ACI8ZM_004822 [Crocinitomix sp.]|jgi:hypothetical protein